MLKLKVLDTSLRLMQVFAQARSHWRAFRGVTPNIFCATLNSVAPRKICFKHIIKTNILPT